MNFSGPTSDEATKVSGSTAYAHGSHESPIELNSEDLEEIVAEVQARPYDISARRRIGSLVEWMRQPTEAFPLTHRSEWVYLVSVNDNDNRMFPLRVRVSDIRVELAVKPGTRLTWSR